MLRFAAATTTFRTLMQARTHSCIRTMPIMTSLANTTFSRFNHTLAVKTRFTKDHEWLVVDNHGVATIGITDYAQKALGDVVFVEVPIIGDTVKKNDHIGAIESVKAASDIYTPVSGDIFLVNEKLTAEPSLINKSAEVEGWFVQIKMSNIEETDSKDLMDEDAYAAYCEKADKDNDA